MCWVDRDNPASRQKSSEWVRDTLSKGTSIGLSPEGIWCLEDNKLALHFGYGLVKSIIEASKSNKVYIVPVVIDYNYKTINKIKSADVKVCPSLLITKDMDYKSLTSRLEDIFWTERWNQIEENAKQDPHSKKITIANEDYYVSPRTTLSKDDWDRHLAYSKAQYKLDWEKETQYELQTKEQKLQKEMEPIIRPNGSSYVRSLCKKK